MFLQSLKDQSPGCQVFVSHQDRYAQTSSLRFSFSKERPSRLSRFSSRSKWFPSDLGDYGQIVGLGEGSEGGAQDWGQKGQVADREVILTQTNQDWDAVENGSNLHVLVGRMRAESGWRFGHFTTFKIDSVIPVVHYGAIRYQREGKTGSTWSRATRS